MINYGCPPRKWVHEREELCVSDCVHAAPFSTVTMSMRPAEDMPTMSGKHTPASAMRLRSDIDQARAMQLAEDEAAAITTAATAATANASEQLLSFDELTETEKSAATIGVSPNELKPIGFMNAAHYRTLLENNAIAGRLTQQIEAYKMVGGTVSSA